MNIERERAAFEWWASDEGKSPRATERVGGCYKLAQIQSYWMAWQARAAQLAPADEAVRRDAERYRWLRKGANRGANDDVAVVRGLGLMDYGMSAVVYTYSEEIDGDDLDAAIDQARGKGEP